MIGAFYVMGMLRCGAPGVGDGTPVEELESEEVSAELAKKYYEALFDVSHFMGKFLEHEERDFTCNAADAIEIGRAFALAPKALEAAIATFNWCIETEIEEAMAEVNTYRTLLLPVGGEA